MSDRLQRFASLLLVVFLAAATLWAVDATASDDDAYRQEIESWRQERHEGLKKKDGWLTLVGLHWLKPGENRFGSDPSNPVILPPGKAPAVAGVFTLEGTVVALRAEPGVAITADGQEVKPGMVVYSDGEGKPVRLRLGPLTFFVIQRGDRLGIRVMDNESPALAAFKGMDNYPIRPEWRFVARFEPYKGKAIPIVNILGQVQDLPAPGAVVFERQGKTYRLDALEGSEEGELFLIFGDQSNGKETYGGGRYIDTQPPKDGKVVVDFNTAYNPPCVFTPFATCPLPPPQNKLSISVEAGEKSFTGPHS